MGVLHACTDLIPKANFTPFLVAGTVGSVWPQNSDDERLLINEMSMRAVRGHDLGKLEEDFGLPQDW